MITVGMIKKALENIPDDVVIEFNNGENIASLTMINVSYNEISKNVLKVNLCDYVSLFCSVCAFYKYSKNKKLSLSSLIQIIKTNDYNPPRLNIDDNIRNVIIYKLFDNYQYLKEKMLNYFDNNSENSFYETQEELKRAFQKSLL